jgi:hypothetical protein
MNRANINNDVFMKANWSAEATSVVMESLRLKSVDQFVGILFALSTSNSGQSLPTFTRRAKLRRIKYSFFLRRLAKPLKRF